MEIGRIETSFGILELHVVYRKDVSSFMSGRAEVIPAESIIPDYAPSLSHKIPIRSSKPVEVLRQQSSSGRNRSNTAGVGMTGNHLNRRKDTEAQSHPNLTKYERLSFSPPVVGAHSLWEDERDMRKIKPRERQLSEPPFPIYDRHTPRSGSIPSHSQIEAFSISPREDLSIDTILGRTSESRDDFERVLTAVSPPSFSMYEKALHESPVPEYDGPVFSIEGSFSKDDEADVNSFVRFCQSKPTLSMIELEKRDLGQYLTFVKEQRYEHRKK